MSRAAAFFDVGDRCVALARVSSATLPSQGPPRLSAVCGGPAHAHMMLFRGKLGTCWVFTSMECD